MELPAFQNDVLHALALTGGLPGVDAANEIVILRGYPGATGACEPALCQEEGFVVVEGELTADGSSRDMVRIPLRWWPSQPPPIRPQDVVLQTGDIVFIEARESDLFYTGGLLPTGEYPLPRDYDLTVTEAVAQVGGPLVNGGINSNNLSGAIVASGVGSPSPRLLTVVRTMPYGLKFNILVDLHQALNDPAEDIRVMPGDLLILQETKHQALVRYATQVFNFSFFHNFVSRTDATGTTSVILP